MRQSGIKLFYHEGMDLKAVACGLRTMAGTYVALIKPNDYYGRHYVEDARHAILYAQGADYIGRRTAYGLTAGRNVALRLANQEFCFVRGAASGSILFRAELSDAKDLKNMLGRVWFRREARDVLALSRYGYVVNENGEPFNDAVRQSLTTILDV